jgi:hypothetical protein
MNDDYFARYADLHVGDSLIDRRTLVQAKSTARALLPAVFLITRRLAGNGAREYLVTRIR